MARMLPDARDGPPTHLRVLTGRDFALAGLAALAVFVVVAVLVLPSEEHSSREWASLGPIRATWEFGKDVIPPVAAAAAFLGTLIFMQRQPSPRHHQNRDGVAR